LVLILNVAIVRPPYSIFLIAYYPYPYRVSLGTSLEYLNRGDLSIVLVIDISLVLVYLIVKGPHLELGEDPDK